MDNAQSHNYGQQAESNLWNYEINPHLAQMKNQGPGANDLLGLSIGPDLPE